jgi:hypothetical protein
MGGPQNRSGRGGEEKNSQPLPGIIYNKLLSGMQRLARWQEINRCVRQGRPISLVSFNFYLYEFICRWLSIIKNHITVDRVGFAAMLYANDQVIIVVSENKL